MRKGLLGSVAALVAGAGAAWAQPAPAPLAAPAGLPAAVGVGGAAPGGLTPANGNLPALAGPGQPATIMPPGNYGPGYDPLGLGPVGGFGPPPSPTYPMPGPYAAQSFQSAPADGADGGLGYGLAPRWWFDGEYLLWFNRGQPVGFPLLTTSAAADVGLPGRASTAVLVGNERLGYGAISGMRLSTGFFGDADRRFGFHMSGWFTESRANVQTFGDVNNTAGIPVLARPIVDVNRQLASVVLSAPGVGGARAVVGTSNSSFSVEPSAVWNLYRSGPGSRFAWSVDAIVGYRFLELKEDLFVGTSTALSSGTVTPVFQTNPFGIVTIIGSNVTPAQANVGGVLVGSPTVIRTTDSFRTTNHFNGGTLGLRGEARYGVFTMSTFGKVSLGSINQRLDVQGFSTFNDPGATANGFLTRLPTSGSSVGGVLANASSVGSFNDNRFTAITEVGGNFGVALTRGLTGYVGWNILYLPDVIRPGTQATNVVSSAAIPFTSTFGAPGAVRAPQMIFDQTHYWLGGVSFGLQLKY